MRWKTSSIFSFLKNEKNGPSSHLDLKLLRQARGKNWPNLSQFKYLGRFLDRKEKLVLYGACLSLILSLLSFGAYTVSTRSVLVPKNGGEYSEGLIGHPKYINPIFATTNDIDSDLTKLVYSGLFKYKNGQLTNDMAESFTVAPDQKTYDINLRQNLRWSDGEPVTVDDILFTFEMIQSAETGSPLIASLQGVRVNKIGENTVRFTLKTPYAPFLQTLTIGILPEHIWSETPPSSMRLTKYNLEPIGSGPFKFQKMVKDTSGNIQSYTLVPNDNYYDKKPYLQTINFKFFESYAEAVSALRSQNISGLSFVPHDLKEKVDGRNFALYTSELPQYTALFFNQENDPALKNYDLRLALAKAIDKNTLVKEALYGDGLVLDAPILPGNLGYAEVPKILFDTASANQSLDKSFPRLQPEEYFKLRHEQILNTLTQQAGDTKEKEQVTVSEADEKRIEDTIRAEMSSGQPFYRKNGNDVLRLTITTADTPEYIKTANEIAKMWSVIGIQTSIKTVGSHQIIRDALKEREYEIMLYGEMIGADPDLYAFWHSSQVDYPGMNLARFSDRDADKALEDARATLNSETRSKLYQKFQNILATKLPAIVLYSPTYITSISKDIYGVEISNLANPSDRFSNLTDWYTKTKRVLK